MTPKILIVDDEPEVCEYLEAFLGNRGYEVASANDGKTALERIHSNPPHLILLDIRMPEMDGLEVLRRLKTIDQRVGVIILTAVQDDAIAKQALAEGADDYITKPIDLDYLENSVMVKIADILG